MSVRVKNISAQIKKSDSTNVEEFLVERYESLIFKESLLTSLSKWVFIVILLAGAVFNLIYGSGEYSKYYLLIPVFVANITYCITFWGLRARESGLENKITDLQREIVKVKLKKEFP